MATHKQYMEDRSLMGEANVTSVSTDGTVVRLERTLFHPQGGGQPADTGLIAGIAVLSVRHADASEVDHFLEKPAAFVPGDLVALEVDADQRRDNARHHSAGHLIADVVEGLFDTAKAVQGHHWPGESRVEFTGLGPDEAVDPALLQDVVNRAVASGMAFDIVKTNDGIRALKIGSGNPVGCGGTHVSTASELQGLIVTKVKRRKGRTKVSYSFT